MCRFARRWRMKCREGQHAVDGEGNKMVFRQSKTDTGLDRIIEDRIMKIHL